MKSFNPLPYVAIIILSVVCIMQTINVMESNKRAEMWRSEAVKLSHDWVEIDSKNRATIANYQQATETCVAELKRRVQ